MPALPKPRLLEHVLLGAILMNAALRGTRAGAEDPPGASVASSVYQGSPQASAGEEAGRAERIVAACLAGLARHPSISARMRQLARVGDREMVGAGQYVQQGLGEDQRFRFESSLTVNTDTYNLLEVGDGLAFWSYQKHADLPPSVNRVDCRRVRSKLEAAQPGRFGTGDAITQHLGGVQRTLALIRESFRFVSAESATIDGMPVWRLEGRWIPERLAALEPKLKSPEGGGEIPPESLPEGMPWSVVMSIGKRELFPFRIEWFAVRGRRPASGRVPEQIAVLEFYDVQIGEPIDATAFVYKPATEGLMDVTESFAEGVKPLRP